jgi:hypothetical protein
MLRVAPDRNEDGNGGRGPLRHFWDSRMRRAIVAHGEAGGEGMKDIVAEAVESIAVEQHRNAA